MELADCARRLISIPPADNVGTRKPTIRLNGIGTMRQAGCLSKFTNAITEEFQLRNFRLGHYPVEDFYKSQWQSGDRSFWFLLYRWCVAGFYIGAGVATAIKYFDNARFFIYLTDWGFILCMIATTYGAVLTTLWHFDKVDGVEQGWSVKIFWVLHWSALVLATVITLMFWTLLLPVSIGTMRQLGCWSKFTNTVTEQFQVKNFRLVHSSVEDFFKSQWQFGDRSFWFLLYRWCVAGFYIAAGLAIAIRFFDNARFFIQLTNWGFILCAISTTYGAVLTTLWHFDKVDTVEQGWGVKIFWMLHWSALVLSTIITLMFWTLLLPADPSIAGDPYNILQHAANSVVMVIDHFVVAFPSRILHFVYPLAIGTTYLLFSIIYYFCGGTGANGVSFIYPILDWGESPLIACLSVVIAVICCFIFSFILFWLYKLRVYLWETFANTQKPHTMHY